MSPPIPSRVLALAEVHVTRYERQLTAARSGNRFYREEGNAWLLKTWQSIREKGGHWDLLSGSEAREVMDAITDEVDE